VTPFRDLSIRNKLIAIILLTTTISLACTFGLIFVSDIRGFKRDMIENAVTIARVTAEGSVSDLAFGDREDAVKTLGKLASVRSIDAAYLFDGSGALFASYERWPKPVRVTLPADTPAFRDDDLHVTEPVQYQNERYGTVYLVVSTAGLQSKIHDYIAMLIGLVVIVVVASLLLALRFEKIISRPILNLAAVAREISEKHDYTVRVERDSSDEIGILSDGFNDMLAQIERRQRERDEADQRTREKSQFLANMSHELRTPLNAIIGFSEILKTRIADRLTPREQKFVDNIHTSGQHLLGIVNDILDLSKIEAGRMEIHPERFSVEAAVEGVCNLMRGVSGRRNIVLMTDIPRPLPELEADPVKVKQILYNLLSNAVKFSNDHSVVTVRAEAVSPVESPLREESVRFVVIDRGLGIDPKFHQMIFKEFHQVDATTSRQFEGTGLGLSLVRRFVEMHKGTIALESELGRGSTFTVFLPFVYRGEQALPPPPVVPPGDQRPRLLVIEDEREAFEAIKQNLAGTEYVPVWARSGEEGISVARTLQPAAITLDLVLPGMEGWDVLKMLKADTRTSSIPVIIVSVVENRELAVAFGADDYILKPVDCDLLLSSLQHFVYPPGESNKVLIIDDDRAFHELLESRLAPAYEVLHSYSAADGLARVAQDNPALVILDLMMEQMDGFEVALRLKSDPRTARLPILVMTAKEIDGTDRLRLRGKINALMQKGEIQSSQLVSVIHDLLERSPSRTSKEPRLNG
jgi:signal transduction histidine kinase/CheY-like chemotaxis protein